MADNIPIDPTATGIPKDIATDDIGGRHFQILKVAFGADGTATQVDASNRLPVATGATSGAGVVDANTQRVTLASNDPAIAALDAINADLGAPADAAATTDAGTFSITAFIKRGMANWTTLLARIPALVTGRIPVDASGVTLSANIAGTVAVSNFPATQAVSAVSLPLPAGAATEAALALAATASGAPADAEAASGNGSIIAVLKRIRTLLGVTFGTGVVDATTQRVTLASDGPAVTALSSLDSKSPALISGRIPVVLPAGGSGLTNAELRAEAVPTADIGLVFLRQILQLLKPLGMITGAGSNRLSIDVNNLVGGNISTVSSVTNVTTVAAVNNLGAVGSVAAFDTAKAMSTMAYNTGIRLKLN